MATLTWKITWDDEALDDLDRLDRRTRERIVAAVERLAADDYGNVKRLRGLEADFRLRVGDWRILFRHGSIQVDSLISHNQIPRHESGRRADQTVKQN